MAIRKILGTLLIVLIGLPILFGVIWAVGLVRATVSSDFLVDLPQEIIAEIPGSIDAAYALARDGNVKMDREARAWLQAAEKTGISPRELIEKTGILAWMKGELAGSLRQVGEVLRGESSIHSVEIDMRPLKIALLHPEMDRFLEGLLQNLPVCDEQGLKAWQDRLSGGSWNKNLPACRPDVDMTAAKDFLFSQRVHEVDKIDDTVEIMENVDPLPFERFGVTKAVSAVSYLLFLLPALIILCGALLANRAAAGRLRWTGISILAGSLPVMLMAFALKKFSSWAIGGGMMNWHSPWMSRWDSALLDKFSWIPDRVFDALFSPVFNTAGIVTVVGVVLIALSYSARSAAPKPLPKA